MLRIGILALFTGTVALAQPAKTLPGGAVLKPERPVPIVPLQPPSLPPPMQPLSPIIGSFSGATQASTKVSVQCLAVAANTWIRCDVAVGQAGALLAIGWDEATKSFRIFVGDSAGKSTLYRGHLKAGKLTVTGTPRLTLDVNNPQQLVFSSLSEVVTLARER
jgi:hypothetical protein